jgi:Fic family protein
LIDILAFESEAALPGNPQDIEEVVNYIKALNYGLQRFDTLPLSLRLIREIHAYLLAGVRGADRHPGEFRTSQNWIGHLGCSIQTARFVPPPLSDMHAALNNLEAFLRTNTMPILLKIGIIHAQFEIIHPFLDRNGRIGRLLIILILCYERILSKPLLYLSYFFKLNRLEYYQYLRKVHDDGDWEAWLKFFLRGIYEVAQEATTTAQRIVQLREVHRDIIVKHFSRSSSHAYQLLEYLYQRPIITINSAIKATGISYANANKLVTKFQKYGILREMDHMLRNRRFAYTQYLALFASGEELQANFALSG